MGRTRTSSGAPWESPASYSRAVRTGDLICVSGTVAMQDGEVVGENDAGAQTRRILEIISTTLTVARSLARHELLPTPACGLVTERVRLLANLCVAMSCSS